MITTIRVLLTTVLFLAPAWSFAEGGNRCKADIEKFCKDVKKGGGRIVKCLKEHEAELSEPCKKKESEMKERVKEAHDACKADIEKLCKDVKPGDGRVFECLKKNDAQLSAGCKAVKDKKDKQ